VAAGIKGQRGIYRFERPDFPRFSVTGANLVGLAFTSDQQHLILASTSAIFRLAPPV
jgi:hypothetical protein